MNTGGEEGGCGEGGGQPTADSEELSGAAGWCQHAPNIQGI